MSPRCIRNVDPCSGMAKLMRPKGSYHRWASSLQRQLAPCEKASTLYHFFQEFGFWQVPSEGVWPGSKPNGQRSCLPFVLISSLDLVGVQRGRTLKSDVNRKRGHPERFALPSMQIPRSPNPFVPCRMISCKYGSFLGKGSLNPLTR